MTIPSFTTPTFSLPTWTPLARLALHNLAALQAESCNATPLPTDTPWPLIGRKLHANNLSATIFAPNGGVANDPLIDPLDAGASLPAWDDVLDPLNLEPAAMPPEEAKCLHLRGTDIVHALRLAASIGSLEAFERMRLPGALTLIEGLPADAIEALSSCLKRAFFSGEAIVTDDADAAMINKSGPIILHPPATTLARPDAQPGFERSIARAIGLRRPLVVLAPAGMTLPAVVVPRLSLAPYDQACASLHLSLHYPPEEVARALPRLPGDADLAALPMLDLLLAMRAPDAMTAASQMHRSVPEPKRKAVTPKLDRITGYGEAGNLARRMMSDFAAWQRGELDWSDLTRSALFFGPPGTGKTWLARAMGAEPGVNFINASLARWQACGHLGDMLKSMRSSFAEALSRRPAVLFIDEIDSVGSRESTGSDRNLNYTRQVINALLECLDGAESKEGVLILAACNNPEVIDPAVLRPGRFDRKVRIDLPGLTAVAGILRQHLPEGIFPEESLTDLARSASGRSAAEIEGLVREAKSAARQAGRSLRLDDLKAQLQPEAPGRAEFDRTVAIHEAGHAMMAHRLGRKVLSCQITTSGGLTQHRLPLEVPSVNAIENDILIHVAGRAAERLACGSPSGGAGGFDQAADLALATRLALALDHRFGLGDEGPTWTDRTEADLMRDPVVRRRVRARIEALEQRAVEILSPHLLVLRAMAECLVDLRTLEGDELDHWLAIIPPQAGQTSDDLPPDPQA